MAKRRKRDGRGAEPLAGSAKPFNNPFAGLEQLVPQAPPGETSLPGEQAEPAGPAAPEPERANAPAGSHDGWTIGGKVVLRCERRGHGGKTVTVVSGMVLRGTTPEQLASTLGKQLGCGVRIDGERVLLAGDQRDRAEPLLRARGATRVVVA